ncbi:MAG: cation transporter [Acidobacteria bacterium]|nr:cation transporter [Acidobacteriota bacterium]
MEISRNEIELSYGEVIMEEKNGRKEKMLTGGVVLAAVTASLCCTIPLFFAGAGVTAIIVAEQFAAVRPYLLGVTGLLLAAGFYYGYRQKSCEPGGVCATPQGRRRVRLGLWLATAFAVVLTTIPYWSPAVVRGMAQTSQASSAVPVQKATLQISGMFCELCAAGIENSLKAQAGVRSAQVHFSESAAEVEYEPSRVSLPQIQNVIERAGYRVEKIASGSRKKG